MNLGSYPESVRPASIKCIDCNAPAVITQAGDYVCVDCGVTVIEPTKGGGPQQDVNGLYQGRLTVD